MAADQDPLRVVVVDDSALFRDGLTALLATTNVNVVGQAASPAESIVRVAAEQPDVVVMDIHMPPTFTDEGLQATRELKRANPGLGVLLLSAHLETASAARLLDEHSAGLGYVLKDRVDNVHALTDCLRRVSVGELVLDPEIVQGLFRRRRNVRLLQQLSDRERAVLQLMAEGRSNAGIAAELHVAAKTVESHVATIFTKLHIPASADDNRRVLAVLTWMRTHSL